MNKVFTIFTVLVLILCVSCTERLTLADLEENRVARPTFNPSGGLFITAQKVTISCATNDVTIHYTTDGKTPVTSSPLYTTPINITKDTTLKAKAFKPDLLESYVAITTYDIGVNELRMVYIPDSAFIMGGTKGPTGPNELPTHNISLNSFYIGKYLVMQKEYEEVTGSNPAQNYGIGDNYPVYNVNWYDAIKFCNLLSMKEGLTPVYSISGSTNPANWGAVPSGNNSTWDADICDWEANGYRLPTEAEWECAAREGTNNPDYLYSGSDNIGEVAWYSGNNSPNGTKPVGGKAPNALGIYDMSGNLYEWCWDWFGESYYSSSPSNNPKGPANGNQRVGRGGSWAVNDGGCRVAYRNGFVTHGAHYTIGFRVCRTTQ